MFPSKEAGDYFNNNLIVLKYQLDLADPDGIMERFSIRAYPTFVFVDGDGNEFSRAIGSTPDTESFIAHIQKAIEPENSWAYRTDQLKKDPSYAIEYVKALQKSYMNDKALDMLNDLFKTRSIADNFSEESIGLYNTLITDTNTPVVDFMLQHQKEVSEVMGAEEYKTFLTTKAIAQLSGKLNRLDLEKPESIENLENDIKKINAHPLLKSKYSTFLSENLNNIKAKNIDAIFDNSKKVLSDLSTAERSQLVGMNSNMARVLKVEVDREVQNQRMIALYEIAVAYEKDSRAQQNYQRTLDRLKNPQ